MSHTCQTRTTPAEIALSRARASHSRASAEIALSRARDSHSRAIDTALFECRGDGSRDQIILCLTLLRDRERVISGSMLARSLLSSLIEAMADLDRGLVAPILKPQPLSGRPGDLSDAKQAKEAAAATCDVMVARGVAPMEAAKSISRALNEHRPGLAKRKIEARTVLRWRKLHKRSPNCSLIRSVLTRPEVAGKELQFFKDLLPEWHGCVGFDLALAAILFKYNQP
jgi:hypothetical protein